MNQRSVKIAGFCNSVAKNCFFILYFAHLIVSLQLELKTIDNVMAGTSSSTSLESKYGKETDKRKSNRRGFVGVGEQAAWLCGAIRI